ncbi:MAG: hypothetical protein JJU28_07945 [Cyclobacteriaceae bacterium]|nr:hypothetical protein [Cyclobacteriaceae bacterium]
MWHYHCVEKPVAGGHNVPHYYFSLLEFDGLGLQENEHTVVRSWFF